MPDVPQASLYRHLKRLEQGGLIEVASTRQVRGVDEAADAPAVFAEATPEQTSYAFRAAMGDNAIAASFLLLLALDDADASGCPRAVERGDQITLTGGCATPYGARYEGEVTITHVEGERASTPTELTMLFTGFSVVDGPQEISVTGLITGAYSDDEYSRWESLSVRAPGIEVPSTTTHMGYTCLADACRWDTGSWGSVEGLGRFDIEGYLDHLPDDQVEGELTLRGADTLRVDLDALDPNECAPTTLDGEPWEPVCFDGGEPHPWSRNVETCLDWADAMDCGDTDFEALVSCEDLGDLECDALDYITCLTDNTTCDDSTGIVDISDWVNCEPLRACE